MALKTKVKVGKITSLSDARYCAGMGVDFLGFPVGENVTDDLNTYFEITSWVSGPSFVLELTGGGIPSRLTEDPALHNVAYLEVSVGLLEKMPATAQPLIVAMELTDWVFVRKTLQAHKARIGYLLVSNSVGKVTDAELLREMSSGFQVLLNVGSSPSGMQEIMALPIAGIALEGTPENTPGLKDYSSLSQVLEQLEISET